MSPSRNRISRLQRQASEQGATGQPYSEFREVEQVLEGWQKEDFERSEQHGIKSPVIDTSVVHPPRTELQRKKEVEEALKLVNAAMKAAEGQLDDIPNLPSARLKRRVAIRSWTLPALALSSIPHARTGCCLLLPHVFSVTSAGYCTALA